MLVYFKVGNYKSVKNPLVINFAASSITELKGSNTLKKNKKEFLRSVLLYGANAGGKSKIIEALVFFRYFILSSAGDRTSKAFIGTEAFALNTDTRNAPSFFEAEFIIDKATFRYGFEADEREVKKEWLLQVKATTVKPYFLRIGQNFDIDHKRFENTERLEEKTRPNALFLSVADQWNAPLGQKIINWFDSIYTVHGMMDHLYKEATTEMLKDSRYQRIINSLMQTADLGINSIEAMKIPEDLKALVFENFPESEKENIRRNMEEDPTPIVTYHDLYDQSGKVVERVPFALKSHESEGTRKYYNLIGILLIAVLEGRLVIIDELDARMHTLLTKAILQLFNSDEIHSDAQLLAVSHDTALLDSKQLRRDQIYFVEKDNFGSTRVISLIEYKVRKESPFDKNYLEGKFGGIPFIKNLDSIITNG
jgi:AAA15 family ATPase/GTPase